MRNVFANFKQMLRVRVFSFVILLATLVFISPKITFSCSFLYIKDSIFLYNCYTMHNTYVIYLHCIAESVLL